MALKGEKLNYDTDFFIWLKSDLQTCPREKILAALDGYAKPFKRFTENKFFSNCADTATLTRSLIQYHETF
jgi:hypothetical protein